MDPRLKSLGVLAVIPARGGSKGIPGKNIRKLAGKSLLERTIETARKVSWIDTIVVSTDDTDIAGEAKRCGLEPPFLRPAGLADDTAKSVDAWAHAWQEMERIEDRRFDLSLLLEPTSPMRIPEDLEATAEKLLSEAFAAVTTVSRTPSHYTPHKALCVGDANDLSFFLEDGDRYSTRQAIPALYHRNGACYAATRQRILEERMILGPRSGAVILDRLMANIDEPFDFELAEWLLSRKHDDREKG